MTHLSRRSLLHLGLAIPLGTSALRHLGTPALRDLGTSELRHLATPAPLPNFPQQDPALVQEVVGASHRDFDRVRELVTRQPSLAKASWDWGFGDWETALGAASHVGQKDIARFLIDQGAAPTLFSAVMLGQLDVARAMVAARPGLQRMAGPHGITLLAHARAGGPENAAMVEWLTSLGDADVRPASISVSAEDRRLVAGTYRFGDGDTEVWLVDELREQLGLTRGGRNRQVLWCVSADETGWTFFPSGAPAVRIKIHRAGPRVNALTVADPEVVLTAQRAVTQPLALALR